MRKIDSGYSVSKLPLERKDRLLSAGDREVIRRKFIPNSEKIVGNKKDFIINKE